MSGRGISVCVQVGVGVDWCWLGCPLPFRLVVCPSRLPPTAPHPELLTADSSNVEQNFELAQTS